MKNFIAEIFLVEVVEMKKKSGRMNDRQDLPSHSDGIPSIQDAVKFRRIDFLFVMCLFKIKNQQK